MLHGTRFSFIAALAAVVLFTGCATEPKGENAKANLMDDATATLNKFKRQDTSLGNFMERAHGYVIFPSVGKGGLIVGGAGGRGIVFEKGSMVGYAKMEQITVGFQAGGQDFAELIVFENAEAMDKFKHGNSSSGNYAFSAEASAVALKAGAAAAANFKNGVAVFTMTNAGLMYEASIGGQRFVYEAADDNRIKR